MRTVPPLPCEGEILIMYSAILYNYISRLSAHLVTKNKNAKKTTHRIRVFLLFVRKTLSGGRQDQCKMRPGYLQSHKCLPWVLRCWVHAKSVWRISSPASTASSLLYLLYGKMRVCGQARVYSPLKNWRPLPGQQTWDKTPLTRRLNFGKFLVIFFGV